MLEYLRTLFRLFVDTTKTIIDVIKFIPESIDWGISFFGSWIPADLFVIIAAMITLAVVITILKFIK